MVFGGADLGGFVADTKVANGTTTKASTEFGAYYNDSISHVVKTWAKS
jgi:hypothetical protein